MSRACLEAGSSNEVLIALYMRSEIGLLREDWARFGFDDAPEYESDLGGVEGPGELDEAMVEYGMMSIGVVES